MTSKGGRKITLRHIKLNSHFFKRYTNTHIFSIGIIRGILYKKYPNVNTIKNIPYGIDTQAAMEYYGLLKLTSDEEINMQYNTLLCQEGLKMMTGRYPHTFAERLNNFIDDLILDQGELNDEGYHLNFEDLFEDDKTNIIALKIEVEDRDCLHCFHQEGKHYKSDDIISSFLKVLKNNSQYNREEFVDLIRANSIDAHQYCIQELIDDRCGWLFKQHQELKGFDE